MLVSEIIKKQKESLSKMTDKEVLELREELKTCTILCFESWLNANDSVEAEIKKRNLNN